MASVQDDWEVDWGARQIRRRRFGALRSLREFVRMTRYEVKDLYRFTHEQEATEQGIIHREIIHSGGLPPIGSLANRFDLQPNWTIPRKDLAHLQHGPLTHAGIVIVPEKPPRPLLVAMRDGFRALFALVASVFGWLG